MKKALYRAIEADEIELVYQPQMTADGARLVAVEALARWRRKNELLDPAAFVPEIERDPALARRFGLHVLKRACLDATAWGDIIVSVNISPVQFVDRDLVAEVTETIRAAGLPPQRLELEIVETAFFADRDRAIAELKQLRALGVGIALDDFGTGYASLACLLEMPIDKLKIDKSFVSRVDEIRSAAIVHAVIALARAIGLKVTAEGVETVEQQRFLRAAGCHYLQGFLFSRPSSAGQISAMLNAQARQRSA